MDLNRPALNRASSRLRAGGGNLSSYAYAVNAIGQRQTVTTGGTAMAAPATTRWGYDGLGQLVAEDFGNNQAANPRDRGYAYDLIGNRKNSIQGVTDPLAAGNLAYHANPLNQYDSIGAFQPVHDDDGNLTTGRLHNAALANVGGTPYTATLHWNGENRLVKVEDGSAVKATYQYDFMGRRVRKQVGSTVTWYVYDGYNELGRFTQTGTVAPAIQRTFTWGLDISDTPQGAGGVGGLLAVKVHGTMSATYFPTYDANGNISEYLASNGSVAAHFEYDGFGNTVVNTDTNGLFDYRFSTKPLEDVTGLYYYLYRDYDPVTGRWPSTDPIEEEGGINLYGFMANDGLNSWDYLGMLPDEFKSPGFFVEVIKGGAVTPVNAYPKKNQLGKCQMRLDGSVKGCVKKNNGKCSPAYAIDYTIVITYLKSLSGKKKTSVIKHEREHEAAYAAAALQFERKWHPIFANKEFATVNECEKWISEQEESIKTDMTKIWEDGSGHKNGHPKDFGGD